MKYWRKSVAGTTVVMVIMVLYPNLACGEDELGIDSVHSVKKTKTTLPAFERLSLGFANELDDETYPKPFFAWRSLVQRAEIHGDIVFDSKEWKDEVEDKMFDDIINALRHAAVSDMGRTTLYQSSIYTIRKAFGVEVDTYLDRPRGTTTDKQATLDAKIPIASIEKGGVKNRFDAGVRWRNLDNPGLFIGYIQKANGRNRDHGPRHEFIFHPVREQFVYTVRDFPKNWDFRWEYELDDRTIRAKFLDAPAALQFNSEVRGGLTVFHDFKEDNTGVALEFAIRW